MNEAHFHLIINHFPIIILVVGMFILLSGFLIKSTQTRGLLPLYTRCTFYDPCLCLGRSRIRSGRTHEWRQRTPDS